MVRIAGFNHQDTKENPRVWIRALPRRSRATAGFGAVYRKSIGRSWQLAAGHQETLSAKNIVQTSTRQKTSLCLGALVVQYRVPHDGATDLGDPKKIES